MTDQGLSTALDDVRVVVLPGRAADFAGYLLAHLGAHVTKVAFADHDSRPASFAAAYDRGTERVRLDADDIRLGALVADADVVVTDATVTEPVLGRDAIRALNPRVIHAEISTFGATGPAAGVRGGDLLATAASGFLHLTGAPGETPVRMGADQAAKLAGAEANAAIMIALMHRDSTGVGQHLDVSMRDGMIRATVNAIPKYRYENAVQQRVGDHWGIREKPLKSLWRTRDGWVSFVRRGGALGGRVNHACVAWMAERGRDVEDLPSVDWDAVDLGNEADRARIDRLDELFEVFLAEQGMEEVFHEGLRRGMTIAPVRTLTDVLAEPQLEVRSYWTDQPVGESTVRVPGFVVKDRGPKVAVGEGVPA